MIEDEDVFVFKSFTGLRNDVPPEDMSATDLTTADNVDVTDANKLRRRGGTTPTGVVSPCHSLWFGAGTWLAVCDGDLVKLTRTNSGYTTSLVRQAVGSPRMAYWAVGSRVFFSNGVVSGVYDAGENAARQWGIATPAQPTASVVPYGSLPPGTYQYTVAHQRGGQVSGAPMARVVDVPPGGGGVSITWATPPDDVDYVRVYVSAANGEVMYLADALPRTSTSALVVSEPSGAPVEFLHMAPPEPGEHIGYLAGHMYVARGSRVYRSEPYAPELFDLRAGYQFRSGVTMLAPLEDSILVGTQTELCIVRGKDPVQAGYENLLPVGVVPGSLAYGQAADRGQASGRDAYFMTADGNIMRVSSDGGMASVVRGRFTIPGSAPNAGAAVVRKTRGVVQYVLTTTG